MVGKGLGWSCLVLTLFLPLRNDVLNNRHSVGLGRASVNMFIDGPEAIGGVLQQSPWGVGFPYSSYRGGQGWKGAVGWGQLKGTLVTAGAESRGKGMWTPKEQQCGG